MNKDKKCIKSNAAMKIATIKTNMRNAVNPLDGDGAWFKKAVSELRNEGISIVFDKQKQRYYNPLTINPRWGYTN